MKIKVGTTFLFEEGCYSDFRYHGPFKVIKEFDQQEIIDEFKNQTKPDEYIYGVDFIAWVSKQGYIEDIDTIRWYLGEYEFKPDINGD